MDNLNIKIPYSFLLSNTPFPISGVGTLVSPQLRELYSSSLNWQNYIFLQTIVKGEVKDILKLVSLIYSSGADFSSVKLNKFDIIVNIPFLRDTLTQALSLFFINSIAYVSDQEVFVFKSLPSGAQAQHKEQIEGCMTRENYELYFNLILQLMHAEAAEKPVAEDLSDKPPEVLKALATLDKYMSQEQNTSSKNYQLDNIISKISVANIGYNLLNIYDLTLWQLLEQFQSYTQMRLASIAERSYSVWGGDEFDYELWLKNNNSN